MWLEDGVPGAAFVRTDPTGETRVVNADASHPFTVPHPRTRLIGREAELATVRAFLLDENVPLLTLTGPGGVGKTRLVLAAAHEAAKNERYPNGVCVVDLAPVRDPAFVLPAIGRALGVREGVGCPLPEMLTAFLHPLQILLVLDNCEHVLAAAPQIGDLLAACPGLQVLDASRAPLRLQGEHLLPVPPLALPPAGVSRPEDLVDVAAVALFVARARAVRADFDLTVENGQVIGEICRQLDGLPLAIELAAARIAVLPPPALLARLERRLPLLTGGPHDAPARLQTMRDAIAWSYDLLDTAEQALFRHLAIFTGGFTLEAAEAFAEGPESRVDPSTPLSHTHDVLDLVASLAANSLLQRAAHPDGEPRYGMLETVREYGLERLAESGEEALVRGRHAAWCLRLAERHWVQEASWAVEPGWLTRIEPEHDNMRGALTWLEQTGDGVGLLRLAGALHAFWDLRGYRAEAVDWLERGLAGGQGAPAEARLRAMAGLGRNLERQGCYARAEEIHEMLLGLAREQGDAFWEARALNLLGLGALNQERYDEAAPLIERAMAAFHRLGDESGVCRCRYCSGIIAYGRGDLAAAAAYLEEDLAWRRSRGTVTNLTVTLNPLGLVACDRGDHRAAAAYLAEGILRWEQDGGANREATAEWLAAVARLTACCGRPETAASLYGASEALFEAIGEPLVVPPRSVYRRHVEALRDALDVEAFAAAWAAGRAWPVERAIEKARAVTDGPGAGAVPPEGVSGTSHAFTPRERDILLLLAVRWTDREIANALFVSRRTVNSHVASILAKLGVHSRREAVARARDLSLLPKPEDTSP